MLSSDRCSGRGAQIGPLIEAIVLSVLQDTYQRVSASSGIFSVLRLIPCFFLSRSGPPAERPNRYVLSALHNSTKSFSVMAPADNYNRFPSSFLYEPWARKERQAGTQRRCL